MAQLASANPKNTNAVFKTRSRIIEKIDRLLTLWIQDLELKNNPCATAHIKIKAKSLFDSIKENNIFDPKLTEKELAESFIASNGWLQNYQNRFGIKSVLLCGEAASADHETAKKYPIELQKFIESEGYCEQQIFNADEAALQFKMPPTKSQVIYGKSCITYVSPKNIIHRVLTSTSGMQHQYYSTFLFLLNP